MQRKKPTKGKCELCGKAFSRGMMAKHLSQCKKQSEKNTNVSEAFRILVNYPYDARYWLYIDIESNATLRDLDDFLRDIWLECCGHMSAFQIHNQGYTAPEAVIETGDLDMDVVLDTILTVGDRCEYEYDFGTTTDLRLSIIKKIYTEEVNGGISLLARNEPTIFLCQKCGATASKVCTDQCLWDKGADGAVFCDKCSASHKCEEFMRLLIVNSPRIGVCAYEG